MKRIALFAVALLAAGNGFAEFTLQEDDAHLTVLENGKQVLTYNFALVPAPKYVPEQFKRGCYIHPLYGFDGEILTQDFPIDHFHHRGVFWAWPECKVGDKLLDVWQMKGARQHHEKWLKKEVTADGAEIGAQNIWSFDDAPDKAIIREEAFFCVRPADDKARAIDFDLKFTNVSDDVVTFLGAKNKGYGGLSYRPNTLRLPLTFTTASGVCEEDALRFDTPWADVALSPKDGASVAGVSIFQNPINPGYPFPGWMFRHYGFLGVSWPHEQEHALKPGESFQLKYRMLVHRGGATDANVAERFQKYIESQK